MKIDKFAKVLAILQREGLGSENIGGGHDEIYLPVFDDDHPLAEELTAAGAHWNGTCWSVYASC